MKLAAQSSSSAQTELGDFCKGAKLCWADLPVEEDFDDPGLLDIEGHIQHGAELYAC